MRNNPVKERLLRGEAVFGTFGWEFLVPGLPQMARACGAEFLLLDMEHAGAGFDQIKTQAALCRGIGVVPMARVPTSGYDHIARVLDAGAMGVMVPMVGSAEEARHIVSCTRYPPAGRRGAAFGFAADDYEGGPVEEIVRVANERTLVICLIETAEGVENVDAIAAVPGVDVIWLGHFDLTNFLGIPGRFDHPRYLQSLERMQAAAARHGKALGVMTAGEAWSRDYWARGFRMFAAGVDAHLLQSALRAQMSVLHTLARPGA